MFAAARRGHASIAKYLRLPSISSTSSNLALSWKYSSGVARLASIPVPRAFNTTSQWRQEAAVQTLGSQQNGDGAADEESKPKSPETQPQHGPVTRFAELGERKMVSPTIVENITSGMKLDTMTHVQTLTINETLKGTDVLAQARTGTGKTLAFVIPVLQKIISVDPALEFPLFQRRHRGGEKGREREVAGDQPSRVDIRAIVISPTRELAEQIAAETRKVTRNTGIIVQTAVGGTMKREGLRKIIYEGCHLLVGTPGRLLDVLSDPYSRVSAPKLSALVLDEADRLLDDGFSKAIDEIKEHLPDLSQRDRQTLLFSATIPREVMYMVRRTMKPDFKFVRTVKEGEQETHMKVPQKLAFVKGFENLMPALVELCKREQEKLKSSEQPFKTIVYFGTKNEVALAAATFANLKSSGRNVFYPASIIEMHGKLSQAQRTKAADTFRRSESSILLSSDVTSRGMDFPNVTHVIQVGIPQQREAYVHRIGRTARGDKGGEGWLLLTDLEKVEARSRLRDLPLVLDTSLETAWIDMSQDGQLSASAAETLTQTIKASKQLHPLLKNVSYTSMLGLYATMPFKAKLVESLNARARYCWGMETPPSVSGPVAHKLGYGGMPGIVIRHSNAYNRAEASRPEFGKPSYHDLGPSGGEGYGGIGKPRGNSAMNSRAPWTGRGRVAPRRARNRDDRGGMSGY